MLFETCDGRACHHTISDPVGCPDEDFHVLILDPCPGVVKGLSLVNLGKIIPMEKEGNEERGLKKKEKINFCLPVFQL
jgi:hypothetical protein